MGNDKRRFWKSFGRFRWKLWQWKKYIKNNWKFDKKKNIGASIRRYYIKRIKKQT